MGGGGVFGQIVLYIYTIIYNDEIIFFKDFNLPGLSLYESPELAISDALNIFKARKKGVLFFWCH